ncbi:MAG: NADH-quinone oxidoreductase subunit M, partial [Streptomycetaceae bacterium]|nr:NADH-quinone oxidoreductase subunit M [Streptomycetaceae bacterium]
MKDFPWLTVLWVVPLVGAVATAFLPRRRGRASAGKAVALAFAGLTLLVGVAVAAQFHAGDGMQLAETHDWISSFGVHYALGVDGLGLLMILLTVVLTPIVFVAAWHDADHDPAPASFFAWALALESFALA